MIFADNFLDYSENIALISEQGEYVSYRQLEAKIIRFSQALTKTPEKKLIFLPANNSIASVVAYCACLKQGHTIMLLNPDLWQTNSDAWLSQLIELYQPNAIIDTAHVEPQYQLISNKALSLHQNLALLLSTSGSTGSPKQVRLSYQNLQSNAQSIVEYLGITSEERAITTLPMHYSYGLSVINSHLVAGASIVLSEHSIVTRDFWNLFKQQNVTSMAGVPYTYQTLRKLRFNRMSLPSLRYMTQAGGRLAQDDVIYFTDTLSEQGKQFFVMYGQTEATARMSYLTGEALKQHPDSIGNAIPGGELTLDSASGELLYQGDNVMMGYAHSAKDLYLDNEIEILNTGDLAYQDEQGNFYLRGRQSRTIKLFGLRVDLDEVETRLIEQGWQVVCLCIVSETGTDDKLAIVSEEVTQMPLVENYLVEVMKLQRTSILSQVLTEIPRTASGKVHYHQLLEKIL